MPSRIVLVILCAASVLHAQTSTATLQGTVTDPNGAVLVGAAGSISSTAVDPRQIQLALKFQW
jgi:hypothetical protein